MTAATGARYEARHEARGPRYEPRGATASPPAAPSSELVQRAKAELVVWRQRAEVAPAKAWSRHRYELGAVWFGGDALRKDWWHWVRNRARHAEIDEQVRQARRQDAIPARVGKDRADAIAEASHRMRLTLRWTGLVLLALLTGSVSSYRWSWGPELLRVALAGVAATLLLLVAGRYYRRPWLTALSPVPLPVLAVLGIESLRWWPAVVFVCLLLLVCEQRGLRVGRNQPRPSSSAAGLRRQDWMTLWETVERVLLARGKEVKRTDTARPLSSAGQEVGVEFGMRCSEAITSDDVRAIERDEATGFPVGASSWVPDPAAAGSGGLRLLWEDPLPPSRAPRREPMSLRYNGKFAVAVREGGRLTEIGIGRQRVILVGNSGGGKSQAEQVILDAVCDMPDADWSGIDVQDGPTLKAYRTQWNCTGCHFTRDEALLHLRALRALCVRRNQQLDAGMDGDLDGRIDQWWQVGTDPQRRGHVLFIDELSSLTADKECREELVLLLEVCRKASVSVVMATPDLDTNRVPAAARDQAGVKVGFSMPFADAVLLFGKGSTQSGWEPFRFDPADDDSPNDAGKSFVRGAAFNRPEVHRWFAMDRDEIGDRNQARREWREQMVVAPAFVAVDEPTQAAVDAVVVPEPLATLERLTAAGDVHTETVLRALGDGWTAIGLAKALRPHGVRSVNVTAEGVQAKGFRADQVKQAVRSLDEAA